MTLGPDEKAAIGAATEATLKPLHELIRDLAGPAVQELGETWRDSLRVWRLQRAVRLARRVKEILTPLGIAGRPIPLKVLLPALEHASLEDDDALQDRWAALLARGADPAYDRTMLSVFVDFLRQISPSDSVFLDRCVALLNTKAKSMPSAGRPYLRELGTKPKVMLLYAQRSNCSDVTEQAEHEFNLTLANLIRLGIIAEEKFAQTEVVEYGTASGQLEPGGAEALRLDPVTVSHYFLSPLGFEFVTACQPI